LAIWVTGFLFLVKKSYPSATSLAEENKDKKDDISTYKSNLRFKKAVILRLSIKIKI